jgi:uncharacterized protein (UPF0332 family)
MNAGRQQAIELKLRKSRSLLNEANVLFENKFYATVINRLYYSCFHATKALLLTKDLIPKSHSGVVTLLHQHFVQPGKFDFAQASFYSRLMQQRIEEDYSDNITEDEETTGELIRPAQVYVSYIEKMIEEIFAQ